MAKETKSFNQIREDRQAAWERVQVRAIRAYMDVLSESGQPCPSEGDRQDTQETLSHYRAILTNRERIEAEQLIAWEREPSDNDIRRMVIMWGDQ